MILKFIKGGYDKISTALGKTRSALTQTIKKLFTGKVDEEALESLEEVGRRQSSCVLDLIVRGPRLRRGDEDRRRDLLHRQVLRAPRRQHHHRRQ